MVTPDGVVKILDFGVARLDSRLAPAGNATVTLAHTVAGSVVGTAAYMSPEQARAQEVDYRSDQFSLGLVIYEMLAGKQAFERPSAVQTMSAIVEDEAPPIERTVPVHASSLAEDGGSKHQRPAAPPDHRLRDRQRGDETDGERRRLVRSRMLEGHAVVQPMMRVQREHPDARSGRDEREHASARPQRARPARRDLEQCSATCPQPDADG